MRSFQVLQMRDLLSKRSSLLQQGYIVKNPLLGKLVLLFCLSACHPEILRTLWNIVAEQFELLYSKFFLILK